MLRSEGAYAKVCGVLRSLVKPLRIGLMSSHKPILVTSLQVLRQLTTVVGPQMIPFLGTLLPPLASKVHNNEFGEDVMECLRSIEMIVAEQTYQYASPNDGEDLGGMILKIIKSKVPTYTTVYF